MNKMEFMRQEDSCEAIRYAVDHSPGITSQKLFELAKDWHGGLWHEKFTRMFEANLKTMLEDGYRCTNKTWYPKGYLGNPKAKVSRKEEDPRQTRMFG